MRRNDGKDLREEREKIWEKTANRERGGKDPGEKGEERPQGKGGERTLGKKGGSLRGERGERI